MRIIAVTGWRDYTDRTFIRAQLVQLDLRAHATFETLHIRVGDATGADDFTLGWCRDNGVSHHEFRARRYPSGALMPGAGPQRNREMLAGHGDPVTGPTQLLLGFPRTDGVRSTVPGSGTWGCLVEATLMGIKLEVPAYKRSGD